MAKMVNEQLLKSELAQAQHQHQQDGDGMRGGAGASGAMPVAPSREQLIDMVM